MGRANELGCENTNYKLPNLTCKFYINKPTLYLLGFCQFQSKKYNQSSEIQGGKKEKKRKIV